MSLISAALVRDNGPAIETTPQPSSASGNAPPARLPRLEAFAVGLLVLAAIVFYLWWADALGSSWVRPDPAGFYSEQSDAFLAGQLYLKVQPNPALLRLADPYDPKQFAPYHLIDLTYYRGHYYLYFGVAPVVTLFLPWQALTGSCLTDQAGAAVFTLAGFGLSVWLLLAVRRRYLPFAAAWACPLAVAVLALGNLSLLLLRQPNFPQIPIASAWTWQVAALGAVYYSLHSRRPWPWLALASAACGLAVASRPTFLLGCLLLAPAVLRHAGPVRPAAAPGGHRWPVLAAAFLPIAAIGVGLMIYNAARFGSPFEFGMRYQLAGGDLRHQVLLSPRYLLANAWSYLFSTPHFTRYFPFVEDQLRPLGVLVVFPFTWLALLTPLGVRAQSAAIRPAFRALSASAALAVGGNFVLLSLYYSNWPRYQLDFFLALTWLAALGLLAAAHAWSKLRLRRRLLGTASFMLAGVNIGLGFCFAARTYHAPQRLAALARLAMRPVGWLEAAAHTGYGPV
ncbi:MAG TPA: hypothetical protein VMD31_06955, partial [Opitutaceae bacterium]|nr:hypothetical protein [Opitutaceae bacterium]